MGGLLALHAACARPARVAGLVLVAPAVGFLERRWAALPPEAKSTLEAGGAARLGSDYVQPGGDEVTLAFFEAAARLMLPEAPGSVALRCPVRILHGDEDDVVPPDVSLRLLRQLAGGSGAGSSDESGGEGAVGGGVDCDVTLTLVKGGDHRLSSPRDLRLLTAAVQLLYEQLA